MEKALKCLIVVGTFFWFGSFASAQDTGTSAVSPDTANVGTPQVEASPAIQDAGHDNEEELISPPKKRRWSFAATAGVNALGRFAVSGLYHDGQAGPGRSYTSSLSPSGSLGFEASYLRPWWGFNFGIQLDSPAAVQNSSETDANAATAGGNSSVQLISIFGNGIFRPREGRWYAFAGLNLTNANSQNASYIVGQMNTLIGFQGGTGFYVTEPIALEASVRTMFDLISLIADPNNSNSPTQGFASLNELRFTAKYFF